MALMGYTEDNVDMMAQAVIESAVLLRDAGHGKLSSILVDTHGFLDGLLEEGRI
jgi:hypothetical protein